MHRAPGVVDAGPSVEILAEYHLTPEEQKAQDGRQSVAVAVRAQHLLATAFHPELTSDLRWYAASCCMHCLSVTLLSWIAVLIYTAGKAVLTGPCASCRHQLFVQMVRDQQCKAAADGSLQRESELTASGHLIKRSKPAEMPCYDEDNVLTAERK